MYMYLVLQDVVMRCDGRQISGFGILDTLDAIVRARRQLRGRAGMSLFTNVVGGAYGCMEVGIKEKLC